MSKMVVQFSFGGPEVLEIVEAPEPHATIGQLRVRVGSAGLNPVDWMVAGSPEIASEFGVSLPAGFGNDFAGTVDEVGEGVTGFAVGDRVYGGARGRAVSEHVVVDLHSERLNHTPNGVDDVTASTLQIAGRTADAALAAINLRHGDTVLIGGAAGGVGVFAVQLAKLLGARVIGTGAAGSSQFLREIGAEPVLYGDGLVERVRELAPSGITAAADLHGVGAALAAIDLGVSPERISTIAASVPGLLARAVGGQDATPNALDRIATLIAEGRLSVPIAASFPMARIREAVALQASGHVHGKVVVIP
jgi:NADPH:quinone reductase-like Zn-dependent oxidoreductase